VVDHPVQLLPQHEQNQYSPSDSLMRTNRVNEDCQRREQKQIPHPRQHVPKQVFAELDVGVSERQLKRN
jgi:hypothetical protein